MPFCNICDSYLSKRNNYKCLTCDGDFTSNVKTTNKINTFSFPFEKEKYYEQGFIREKCHAHPQWGISFNSDENYWIVIKNKKSNSNTYYDRMGKDGIYHYTGQGLTGDQAMTGSNYGLKHAASNGQPIHLFWQDNQNSDHKYVGKVKVEKIDQETQPGTDGYPRNVFVFSLRPVD